MTHRFKKRALFAITTVVAVVAAGAALAYFTSSGSGTGTATVGSSSALTLHATVSTTLYPGASSPVSFTVDNPSQGAERIGTITLSSITVDSSHSTCSTALTGSKPDFTMAPVVVNHTYPAGNGQAVSPGATLTMNDTEISQDACQGATLTLHVVNN
jgi:hypothetical protein